MRTRARTRNARAYARDRVQSFIISLYYHFLDADNADDADLFLSSGWDNVAQHLRIRVIRVIRV